MRSQNSKVRIYPRGEHPPLMNLEVNKLGRPYHKVPKIVQEQFDQLDAIIGIYFLKKFRVNTALQNIDFQMDVCQKQAQIYRTETGNIGFYIARPLLLQILHDYYGLSRDGLTANVADETSAITKTEERLQIKLASELVELIGNVALFTPLSVTADHAALITQWSYRLDFQLEGYSSGVFTLLLDSAHVDRLLAGLRQQSSGLQSDVQQGPKAQFSTLPVRLTGRLATVPMTVAELAKLRCGDLLPVSLAEQVPLFIGQQPLFHAAVCEDRGKLFFAEFNVASEANHD